MRTSIVLGGRLFVQAGTLLTVARMLGPHQFGLFAGIAALAVMLGALSTFGTHFVLLGEVSKHSGRRDSVLSYAVPLTLACGTLLLVAYLLICRMFQHEAGISLSVILAIGVAEIWIQPLFGLPAIEHLAFDRTARSQMLTTLPLALRLIAAGTILWWHPRDALAIYAFSYLAASIAALGFASWTMTRSWPRIRDWRLPGKQEFREAAGYAAIAITSSSPAELDKTLASRLLSLSSAGIYSAGARVIGASTLPVIAMMLSALPRLFREGHGQNAGSTRLLRWIFIAAVAYSIALSAALWFAAPLLAWLFGPQYHALGQTIRWLCLAVPFMALRIASGNVLMALGKPWGRVGYELTGIFMLSLSAVLFTKYMGPIGMPLALACSELCMSAVGWFYILRLSGKQFRHYASGTVCE